MHLEISPLGKDLLGKVGPIAAAFGYSVSEIKEDGQIFSIAIIPHTWENTSLKYLSLGEEVNLEVDLMAKYAEQLLGLNNNMNENDLKLKETISKNLWLSDECL